MPDNPSQKPPGKRRGAADDPHATGPGRLAPDDRGNVTWQWANDDALQSDDTAGGLERLQALIDPNLGIVDDGAPSAVSDNPKGLKVGYNPYQSGTLGKTERKKKKSLQELSKWIETKRKAEGTDESSE
jgi:hypothetical protein